jgi:hypothetical protein
METNALTPAMTSAPPIATTTVAKRVTAVGKPLV